VGEKVMPRRDATLRVGSETVEDDGAVYIVKQVQDDWLWTGKGWIRERHVVRIPEAADYYTGLIVQNPGNAWAYNMRGVAWTHQGAFGNAIRDFTRALQLEETADTYANRGAAWLHQGDDERAIEDLTRAIELDDEHVAALSNRGVARQRQGDLDAAIDDLSEAIRLQPDFAAAYSNRGECWEQLGEYEKAIDDYSEAIERETRFATPYALRARLWAACPDEKFRNGKAAVESATAACELTNWKHPLFIATLASAYAEAGDFDEAVKRQEQAIELATGSQTLEQFAEQLELYRQQKPYRLALRADEP
jgi:tetratricopeptide (TPR) repeat protein